MIACQQQDNKYVYKLNDEQLARLILDVQLTEVTMTGLPQPQQDSLRQLFSQKMSAIYGLSAAELEAEVNALEMDTRKHTEILKLSKMLSDSIR